MRRSGRAGAPGQERAPSVGTGWAATRYPTALAGGCSALASPRTLGAGHCLRDPPKPFLAQRNNKYRGYFPTPLSLYCFFSASAQFFGKHKALCLFWVQKEASSFYFKNDLVEMRLYPCFSVLAWPEAVFLSLLQKTDKADEDRGALPVREQEGAWSGCRVDC